ncbi:MAG TPA: phosphatase PAP2 family protein [Candidatus Saccharimonadales bacterium]|nr:phosphatase PAP2 family protein [Candidatus Saccharimonadales bacterium]
MAAKTDTAIYKGNTRLYVVGLASAIVVLSAATLLALGTAPAWEHSLTRAMNGLPESWSKPVEWVTELGSPWMAVVAVVVAFFARFYRLAWRLALSIFGGYAGAYLVKHVVGRERPFELFGDIHARVHETGMGFPSGHATISTIVMLTLLPYLSLKWRIVVPVVILAVSLSRLYLGVHLPLDVVGGMALGTIVVASMRLLPQSLRVFLRID